MDIVVSNPDMQVQLDYGWMYKGHAGVSNPYQEQRSAIATSVMEYNIGTLQGIVFPLTPVYQVAKGGKLQDVAMRTTGSSLATWLCVTALGGAEHGSVTIGRSVLARGVASSIAPTLPMAGSVMLASTYVDTIGEYEPDGNRHDKSSFWSSVGAAMAGGFGGMPGAGDY